MFALKKLRARRAPANQAHVTNLKENPALLAADAAEAAARGFAELETTVGVSRYAPLNAIAILVGSQTGRPGVMTQCAVEERRNLQLAIQGLVTYAETLSVYGTEPVFVDGDDTPWSKAFLASAYASRGVKVRFTSGGGSEALMGHAQGYSMLYLEARCLAAIRAAGSQGVQNGSISCVALVLSVPGGVREILAENVLAAWLDLEVASGNDAIASHSEIRKTAKLMGQFLPGTDFVTSGYSVDAARGQHVRRRQLRRRRPRRVADRPARLAGRRRDRAGRGGRACCACARRRARAVQAVFAGLGFPPVTDAEVEAATYGYSSRDLPDRDRAADVAAADRVLRRDASRRSTSSASSTPPASSDVAEAVLGMQRQRVSRRLPPDLGDHRRPTARVHSAVNDPNRYAGPGTGYRLEGERWELLQQLPYVLDPARRRPRRNGGMSAMSADACCHCRRRRRTRSCRGRPGVRRRARARRSTACRTRTCSRAVADGRARGRRRAAARPRAPHLRRRLHRPRRRGALRLGDRDRAAVEGHGGHPSRRPAAARQPRAVRDVAALHARLLPRDGAERRRRTRSAQAVGPGADRAGQLRPREADRADDAPARARDRGGRPGRRAGRARARVKIYFAGPLFTPAERRFIDECAVQLRAAGFDVFVPHEHELALDGTVTAERIFAKDWAALSEANAVLAILDGPVIDDGTACEIGIFYGLMQSDPAKKGIVGMTHDLRATPRHEPRGRGARG